MPLKYFNCPDSQRREIKQCLEHCPRKEGRCASLPVLYEVGWSRPFTKPSVTQCLNPTRIEYLRLTTDFAVNPLDQAFALLGTRVHRRLEQVAKKIDSVLAEKTVGDEELVGTLDLMEPDSLAPDKWLLIDRKCWGSYSAAKVLKRKDNGEADILKATLQLNGYRVKVEPLGFPVSRMFIECIVRDGGTVVARQNNVTEKMMMIPIERMDDKEVNDYFSEKAFALLDALNRKILPPLCSFEDRWSNKRCISFCEIAESCPEGRQMKRLK